MKDSNNLLVREACLRIYLSTHVSELKDLSEVFKKAWSVGQELYLLKQQKTNGEE